MNFDTFINNEMHNMIDSLDRLVSIPSVGGIHDSEAPFGKEALSALKEVEKIATEMGLCAHIYHNRVAVIDLYPAPFPTVGILTHADVVPAGNGWTYEPFKVTKNGENLYGRGVIDNKGPIVSTLYAMKYAKEYLSLNNNFRLIVGSDEERGSSDLSYYMANQKLPEYVFTPDANYPVINTEKGRATGNFTKKITYTTDKKVLSATGGTVINAVPDRAYATVCGYELHELYMASDACSAPVKYEFIEKADNITEITVYGTSAHASLPENGENALTALCELFSKLDYRWENIYNACPHNDVYAKAIKADCEDEISGKLTFSFDLLEFDGENFKGTFDVRFPVCLTVQELRQKLTDGLNRFGLNLEDYSAVPPHHTNSDSLLVKALLEAYEAVTGKPGKPLAVGGGTYAHGIPGAVAFGPEFNEIDNKIHGADEFISLEHFKINTSMIYNAMLKLDEQIV
ncbi:MAG: M20 family metallopeptidase [Ruminococcaceae bacterium]|nr:M20 family metallopeptidase [Oscillospiraceae bacterium]